MCFSFLWMLLNHKMCSWLTFYFSVFYSWYFLIQTERIIAESSSWHYVKLSLNILFYPLETLWLQRKISKSFKCRPSHLIYTLWYRLQLLVYCFASKRGMECWSYFNDFFLYIVPVFPNNNMHYIQLMHWTT